MDDKKTNQALTLILEAVAFCRSLVLDSIEIELGDTPHWQYTRSRLLRAFGDQGLEKRVKEIMGGPASQPAKASSQCQGKWRP